MSGFNSKPYNCSEDYRYTGKHEDPSGLYYFGARYYDPLTGRFTTRDTVFGDITDPQSQNRYVYCLNNPHKYVDPNGYSAEKALEFILHVCAYSLAYSFVQMVDATLICPRDVTENEVLSWYSNGAVSATFSYGNSQVTPTIASNTGLDQDAVNTILRTVESTAYNIYIQYSESGIVDYSIALDAGMKTGLITYSSRHILPSGAAHNDPLRFMMVVGIKKGVSNAMGSIEDYSKPTTEVINSQLDYQIAFNDYLDAERINHERRGYVG